MSLHNRSVKTFESEFQWQKCILTHLEGEEVYKGYMVRKRGAGRKSRKGSSETAKLCSVKGNSKKDRGKGRFFLIY